jgi:hypothetical protein
MAEMCSEESLIPAEDFITLLGKVIKLKAKIEVKIRIKDNQLDVGRCEKDLGK